MYAIKINAPRDKCGNPRRGWKLYLGTGTFIAFVDEGYLGKRALAVAGFADIEVLDEVSVSVKEYSAAIREHNKSGSLTGHSNGTGL